MSSFLLFFAFYLLLPILPMYLADIFRADKTTVGIILSTYTITALLIRPFAGYLVDSFPRKLLLLTSYVIFVVFFGAYMLAGTILIFGLLRAAHGLGFGLVTISNSTVAIDVMPASRRDEGIGFYSISVNLAMALGPVVALSVYDSVGNYDYIFLTSLAAGVAGLFCVSMIKTRPRPRVEHAPVSLDRFFLVKGWPCAIVLGLVGFSYGALTTYAAVYGSDEVGVRGGRGLFFIVMAAGLILSRVMSARMMKRGELTRVVSIGLPLLMVSYLAFILLKTPAGFFGSAALLGLSYGMISPPFQAMFNNLAHHNQRGAANSTYFISWDLGIGIGVLVGGYIADLADYTAAYVAGMGLAGVALLYFRVSVARYYRRENLYKKGA
jgi:predicted MFS family arabinose efflux permease